MAWRAVTAIKKFIMTMGGLDYEITGFNSCLLFDSELTDITLNPTPTSSQMSSMSASTNYNPDLYNQIVSSASGTINFDVLTKSQSIGTTFYLWREDLGRNVNITFTKTSNTTYSCVINWYSYINASFDIYCEYVSPDSWWITWFISSIGFIINTDIGQAALYNINGYNDEYSSNKTALRRLYWGWSGGDTRGNQALFALIFGNEIEPQPPTDDPYADGGYSTQDGGGGDFDDTSDVISVPSAPLLNLTLNGFISAYVPSITDINDLADWIWGNYDKFDSTKVLGKIFTEPMESILSLHMLPYTPGSSTAIPVTIGNFATGLSMKPLLTQFEDIPCGSLTFTEFWGNYLDYNPFTKIILCLPYVGQVDLDPDEVMGKTVDVLYRVDNLTGAFVCFVYIDGDKILGQYSGSCILTVPVTAGSYAALNAAVLSIAATAAGGFGGAVGSAIGGGYGGMLAAKEGLKLGAGALGETMSSAAGNVNGMKLKVSHSGGLTGASGFMGAQTPYAIIHRPRQSVPENFNQFAGYPSNITMSLEDCSGFTSVRTCVYDGLPFTDAEIKELDEILKGGVFI